MSDKNKHVRKSICLSQKTLEIAQKYANDFYCGNLSAFLASRILEFDTAQQKDQNKTRVINKGLEN